MNIWERFRDKVIDQMGSFWSIQDQVNHLHIEIVYAGKDIGFCVGSNVGWRNVKNSSYCMFFSPNAFLAADFIERPIKYMEAEPKIGMVNSL